MIKTLPIACFLAILSSSVIAQVSLSSGLMAHYPFNGNFNDVSGQGNHGTSMNGASFGADQWGYPNSAAFFDGINDWVSVLAAASLTQGQRFSMAFRFRTSSTAFQVMFSKSNYSGASSPHNLQYQVGVNGGSMLASNGVFFSTNHNAVCTTGVIADNFAIGDVPNLNQWYCVVLTFDKGVKKVYMDGNLVSTVTVSGTANNGSMDSCNGGTFRMGTWWQNDTKYFSGALDEVRIWNRALNAEEIIAVCSQDAPGNTNVSTTSSPDADLQVAPNPTSGDIRVVFASDVSRPGTVSLVDMFGKRILEQPWSLAAGRNELTLSARDLQVPPGIYFLQLSAGHVVAAQRVTIR